MTSKCFQDVVIRFMTASGGRESSFRMVSRYCINLYDRTKCPKRPPRGFQEVPRGSQETSKRREEALIAKTSICQKYCVSQYKLAALAFKFFGGSDGFGDLFRLFLSFLDDSVCGANDFL